MGCFLLHDLRASMCVYICGNIPQNVLHLTVLDGTQGYDYFLPFALQIEFAIH